jgi:hypothetical protein
VGEPLAYDDVLAVLRREGALLESARGPLPSVAALVAGGAIRGSWWSHPRSHAIFAVVTRLRDDPDVVAVRLVGGKVTLLHRRLWPAVARLAGRYRPAAIAALREEHTASGAHRVVEVPFPAWVPADDLAAAAAITEDEALAALPPPVRP